ncbi:serine hydrolase, partial [Actinomadura adrarensis]
GAEHGDGVEATVGSVFQIGSVTKAPTATLVELDAPVDSYLPGFREATVRQLLCHTAGSRGTCSPTRARGRLLGEVRGTLAGVPQIFEPGQMFSCGPGRPSRGRTSRTLNICRSLSGSGPRQRRELDRAAGPWFPRRG